MAKKQAVWGIDIGNSSLKALRCQFADEPGKIETTAFDFIEHSKILSQPGAEPAEILSETLQTFLSRNTCKGDKVAISVSGQNTISRFLKLPPVDPKKIPDIIKYEAKQWLPFDLDDVIWDFQPIGAADRSDTTIPIDSEIGMFAMKRDIAMKTLEPYVEKSIDVDCIQSSPLAIYNFAAFDQLGTQSTDIYDPDSPPESLVVLSVGTDATDVVVTNGFSIWIRSIPIGGNVFTKALTKGLKLTFSKAEYLKRNAVAAQDPKAVFQAMRPVFNDMLSEVHRSLEYYQSLNRKVKFSKILALGNAMKLPGLRQFLAQNLGYEVVRLSAFNNLIGADVLNGEQFKDNAVSFAVSYGLALQLLGESQLSTNLIPKEIVTDRIIREKKPWALAATSALLLGLMFQFAGASRALETISIGDYGAAENNAKNVASYSSKMKSETTAAVGTFKEIDTIGKNLTSNVEGRITWLELLRAINEALPKEAKQLAGKKADEVAQQNRVFVSNIEAITVDSLSEWFTPLKENKRYYPDDEEVAEALEGGTETAAGGESPGSSETSTAAPADADAAEGPKNPATMTEDERLEVITGPKEDAAPEGTLARVVQLVGYHYHNPDKATDMMGSGFLRKTLLRNLKLGQVVLPATLERQMKDTQSAKESVSMAELGISYPTILDIPKLTRTVILNPRVVLEIFMKQRKEMLEKQRRPGAGGFGSTGGFGGGMDSGMGSGGMGGMSGGFGSGEIGGGLFTGGSGGFSGSNARGMQDLGSSFANPFNPQSGGGASGLEALKYIRKISGEIGESDKITLRRFDFVVQFAWVETPPSTREKKREDARLAALEKQKAETSSVLEGETTEPPAEEPATATPESAPAEPAPETPVPEAEPASETPAPEAVPATAPPQTAG
ncbi:MAG: pilus assembly protein PilM [Planctomycetaceae bacterium]|jgi:type IV pilus assembly protein PilM|nr:pilus assembly protein PilM [Planctomycetaceae bacterium]